MFLNDNIEEIKFIDCKYKGYRIYNDGFFIGYNLISENNEEYSVAKKCYDAVIDIFGLYPYYASQWLALINLIQKPIPK